MLLASLFTVLVWVLFLVVISFYAGYLIVLFYFNKSARSNRQKVDYIYPTISLIVPVYNEEKVIGNKIKNVEELIYPSDKLEILFVDGCSTDRTPEIVLSQAQKSQKSLRLIRQKKREGYNGAIIEGVSASNGEIIVLTDAASYYYPDALTQLVKHFADPEIGAATGKEVVLGNDKELGPQLEKSYRFFYDFMRKAETEMDSTPDSKGEILAARREICSGLLPVLKSSLNTSFDSCVPYQAKLMGYRTIYDEQAKYYEYAPASFKDRMTQQIRRGTLLIGAILLFKKMFLKKKYGKFGRLILPVHFILDCLLPSIFVVGVAVLAISTVLNPIGVLPLWVIVAIITIASSKSRSILVSFIQSQFALFWALIKLNRQKNTLFIESIPSTRVETQRAQGAVK
jgi:biofilm PGA synthesis N-glycosyltransferase PgaC